MAKIIIFYDKGTLQRLPFGCTQGKTPAPIQSLTNHIGEVTHTRQARCDELDPEGKPLAFAGKGFELETSNMKVPSPNH
ncbi:hypothetical protein H5410_050129 [Solanum commersonii]|uniref:Uncharacterized protein n=1 Tax=Solanum commersonii TaxID=4109 RepID=A0A9J5WX30_SOLCO|nr:hypothetical protein H5410_050129 [Solanum commersonii]